MKCSKCGKEIANDSKFCEFCGTQIKHSDNNKPVWITLAVLFALSVIGVTCIMLNLQNQYNDYSMEEVVDTVAVDSVVKDVTAVKQKRNKQSGAEEDGDWDYVDDTMDTVAYYVDDEVVDTVAYDYDYDEDD